MNWKNFDVEGWSCMVDRYTGIVLAFSNDGTKQIECNALDNRWVGMNQTLDEILHFARKTYKITA